MIQANELRRFNKVYHEGRIFTVKEVREYDATFLETDAAIEYEDLDAIELSPSILEACGFELLNGIVGQYYIKTDRFLFSFYEGKNEINIQDIKPVNTLAQGIADLKIEYVHQLQNLFYWITVGTELSINLEKVKA